MYDYNPIVNSIQKGDIDHIQDVVKEAIDAGVQAQDILDKGLIAGMNIVGDKMEAGDLFIPEVLRSAQTMSIAVDHLKPMLDQDDSNKRGKMIIGTVKGDLHDIGKNLVATMCEGVGLEVIDLGVDVSADQFMAAAKANDADLIAISALLTTTMPEMKKTITAIKSNGLSQKVKVIVGGAPVTQTFANEIGADGYSEEAGAAVKTVVNLLS